jgi:hypothetical protein
MSEVAAKPGPTDVTLGPLALALLYGQQFIVACNSVSMNLMTSRAALNLKTSLTGGPERIAASPVMPRLILRKLTNGEVCLLLAGARPTESYTPHLYDCSAGAGALCLASDLARYQHCRLGQETSFL